MIAADVSTTCVIIGVKRLVYLQLMIITTLVIDLIGELERFSMNDLPVTGYPRYAQRILGSLGGKHQIASR